MQQVHGKPKHTTVVRLHQLLEGVVVALLGGPNQAIHLWTQTGPKHSGCILGHKTRLLQRFAYFSFTST